jgi:hypothetical protein
LGRIAISVGHFTIVAASCTVSSLGLLYSQSRLFVTIFGFFSVEGCGKRLWRRKNGASGTIPQNKKAVNVPFGPGVFVLQ